MGISGALLVALLVLSIVLPIAFDYTEEDLKSLGYTGIFLSNFFGTASVFIPIPFLTTAGQGLIVALGRTLSPVAVAFTGAAAMTLGETTAYGVGMMGRLASQRRRRPLPGRLGEVLRRAAGFVDRMMARYGFWTLLVLSAVPNPIFEVAGITAGATRLNFWHFLLAVGIGKLIRSLILAYVGNIF